MTYGDKRRKFARMVGKLLAFIHESGYEAALDDGKTTTGHRDGSLHYIGLAQDVLLYLDGVYLEKTEEHTRFGEFWESLGGSWGGRFGDGNHYSLEHNGMR